MSYRTFRGFASFRKLKPVLLGSALALMAGSALATPLAIGNTFIEAGVSDYGTLGSDHSTPPGILYDPAGTGTFGTNDFLTPGDPFELFAIQYSRGGTDFSSGSSNDAAPVDFGASWTLTQVSATAASASGTLVNGADAGNVSILNTYSLGTVGSVRAINITTVITNNGTTPMTGVRFLRSLDPDPDNYPGGSAETSNQLVSPTQACASGQSTGETICILSNDGNYATKSAGISSTISWPLTPDTFLTNSAGVTSNSIDASIGLYVLIGDIAPGASKTVTYSYVFGPTAASTIITTAPAAPVPVGGALWGTLLALGLAASGALSWRRKARA